MKPASDPARTWIGHLDDEELAFVRRFILASGSLKELAQVYGISYPTIRLRLDRLIEKIKVVDQHSTESELEQVLRVLHAEGKLDVATMRRLLKAHQRDLDAVTEDS